MIAHLRRLYWGWRFRRNQRKVALIESAIEECRVLYEEERVRLAPRTRPVPLPVVRQWAARLVSNSSERKAFLAVQGPRSPAVAA